jgi:hypothetical protein
MTATLNDVAKKKPAVESAEQQAAAELVRRAREQGLSLTGPDGLLKRVQDNYFPRTQQWEPKRSLARGRSGADPDRLHRQSPVLRRLGDEHSAAGGSGVPHLRDRIDSAAATLDHAVHELRSLGFASMNRSWLPQDSPRGSEPSAHAVERDRRTQTEPA